MTRRNLLWAVLAVVGGGLAYAGTQKGIGYTCPVTGEQLACADCCPLNGKTAPVASNADADYVCPLTGEKINCPNCCPLNQKK